VPVEVFECADLSALVHFRSIEVFIRGTEGSGQALQGRHISGWRSRQTVRARGRYCFVQRRNNAGREKRLSRRPRNLTFHCARLRMQRLFVSCLEAYGYCHPAVIERPGRKSRLPCRVPDAEGSGWDSVDLRSHVPL